MRRGLLGVLALLLLASSLVGAPAAAADGGVLPRPGHPWFGPALDIEDDTPSAYAERLGRTPSLYTFPADYPLTEEGVDQLRRFAEHVAAQGAVLVLQLEPTVPLAELSRGDADDLVTLLADLRGKLDIQTLVRFAPEMNGSWRPWGQQPTSYVAAFRRLASVVHADAPGTAMVWSPVYGSGYPFRAQQGADSEIDLSGARETAPLDTDGDGRLGAGDDPYGPYYPGDDAVDWAGLFLYRFGQSQGTTRNVLPPVGELRSRLAERWGYPRGGQQPFYERFSAGRDQPMLLETAALHNPEVGGAGEVDLKRRWWREVLSALPAHPHIGAISWLELARPEPEVAGRPVDWRATVPPAAAAALRADLERSAVALGPVTRVHAPEDAPRHATGSAPSGPALERAIAGVGATDTGRRVAAGLLVALLALAIAGAQRSAWRYAGPPDRDLRIDLLRGLLVLGVLALHLPVVGPLHDLARVATALGGLETFVVLSGISVGLAYSPVARLLGHTAALGRRLRRAVLTAVATLTTVLAVYVLGRLPGADADSVGTVPGPSGRIELYAGADHLFDYPPPGWIARDFLSGQLGAWMLVPLALLVVLQALSPIAAGPLHRGWWWAVLPLSWAVYALGRWSEATALPSWSERIAPLLVWQVLFVHGVAAAVHRGRLTAALRRPAGQVLAAAATAGSAYLLWSGRAPATSDAALPVARLVVVATAVLLALAVLTVCWRPVAAVSAAALVPLGRHALLAVLAQAPLVLLVASVPGLDGAWAGTAVVVVAAAALVLLARWRMRDPAITGRPVTAGSARA